MAAKKRGGGGRAAVVSGAIFEARVAEAAARIGFKVERQYRLGDRIYGGRRHIDVVITHPVTKAKLGIECKAQNGRGTTYEKIGSTILDIEAWPFRGLIVFGGRIPPGYQAFLIGRKHIGVEDVEQWLQDYFTSSMSAHAS